MSASSRSFALLPDQGGIDALRKSAEILRPVEFALPECLDKIRELAPDLIWKTFRAPSHNAVCEDAARRLQVSPDKIGNILSRNTKTPDLAALLLAAGLYRDQFGRNHEIASFVLRLMNLEAAE